MDWHGAWMGNPVTNFWKELRQRKVIRVALITLGLPVALLERMI
jgi:hypothetical protein